MLSLREGTADDVLGLRPEQPRLVRVVAPPRDGDN